jgi:hypothetical protein
MHYRFEIGLEIRRTSDAVGDRLLHGRGACERGPGREHADERKRSGSRGYWTEWEDVRIVGVEFQLPVRITLGRRSSRNSETTKNGARKQQCRPTEVGHRNSEALLS